MPDRRPSRNGPRRGGDRLRNDRSRNDRVGDDDGTPARGRQRGLLPPVGARTPGLDSLGDDFPDDPDDPTAHESADWDDDWDDRPNYLVRRAAIVGVAIAAIAALGFGVTQLVGNGGSDASTASPDAAWNTVVVLTADQITLIDPDSGDTINTFDADTDLLDAQTMVAGHVLVSMTDAGRISMTDLTDGTIFRGRAGQDETLSASTANPAIGIVGSESGGDITIIDTINTETLSVADLADLADPLIFPARVVVNSAGTHAAMSDARSFQSVVVDIAASTAELIAGQVVAIDDERVVTAQRAGNETELEFYDFAGERLGSVDVPTPVATLLRPDGTMLLVGDDGSVRTATADGDVSELTAIVDADGAAVEITGGIVVSASSRLIALTDRRAYILDDQGALLGSADGTLSSPTPLAARCVTLGSGRSTGISNHVDVDNAMLVTEIDGGLASETSLDGCTVSLIGGPRLLRDGEVIDVDARSIASLAPDGSAYAVLDGRDTELITGTGDDTATIELADEPAVIRFANL